MRLLLTSLSFVCLFTSLSAGRHAAMPLPTPGPAASAAASNCTPTGAVHGMTFVAGAPTTNTFATSADPELRKFIVYVPSSYNALGAPYPLVSMFHGTGQTAQSIMNKNTWKRAAELRNFIVVYPEALPYLMQDGSVQTKWRTDASEAFAVDPSELPMADDVQFVRELHNTLITSLNIDCDHVYASGFSNGGGFVKSELRVELADVFAAFTSAGGIGASGGVAADYFPANGVDFRPHFEVVGTRDDKKIDNCIAAGDLQPGDFLPRAVPAVASTPCMWDPLTVFAAGVGMDASVYSTVEVAGFTQFRWTSVVNPGPGPTEYRFRLLPNLAHEYPSGTNYPVDYVPVFWTWMRQYSR